MSCPYLERCWRSSYSRYYLDRGWSVDPPDRMTLFMSGFATQEMMPKGGLYAEIMPHVEEGVGLVGLCPETNGHGYLECHEYKRELKREESRKRAEGRRMAYPHARPREWIPKEVRKSVAEKAHYRCVYCGVNAQHTKCVVDHVVPLARGGSNDESNMVFACVVCNSQKGIDIWEKKGSGE